MTFCPSLGLQNGMYFESVSCLESSRWHASTSFASASGSALAVALMGAADEGVLSAIGINVFAEWVEFAVEFEDNVEFGEVELNGSEVGPVEAAVAVKLLFEDTLAVDRQQWQKPNALRMCRDFSELFVCDGRNSLPCSSSSLRLAIAVAERANKQIMNRILNSIVFFQLVDAAT